VNTQNLKIFLRRNKTCGNLLTTVTSTSSSLGSLTPFQNFNSTGLNLANLLLTCLLEWSSLHTSTSNLLQIKTKLQRNLYNSLHNLYNLHNQYNLQLNWCHLRFHLDHNCNRLFNFYLHQTCNPLPDQVGYKIKLTNTIYDLARTSTTRNCTQASNKDAENFVAKQRPWLPGWH